MNHTEYTPLEAHVNGVILTSIKIKGVAKLWSKLMLREELMARLNLLQRATRIGSSENIKGEIKETLLLVEQQLKDEMIISWKAHQKAGAYEN